MPRVLYVLDSLEVGGAERSLLEMGRHLTSFEPVVCHLSPAARLAPDFGAAGIPTVSLGLTGRYPLVTGARALSRTIREQRPDLVHSTLYTAGITARLARRGQRPLVHTWVNEPVAHPSRGPHRRGRRRLAERLDAWTAFRVNHFVANSRSIAESHRQALAVPERRVSVVYRGRDPARFTRVSPQEREVVRHELGLASEHRVILQVGRLRPQKGHLGLLEALHRLLVVVPSVRLVLAGEGPSRSAIEQRIEALGLQERVLLLGHRDDVPALLAMAEIFAFPSSHEGHPGALVEAMLAGCPIVASDLPVHRETLQDGESGLLTPVGDAEALAGVLADLLHDPERAREMGENARRTARTRFDIRHIVHQHEDLYTELCARTGARRPR